MNRITPAPVAKSHDLRYHDAKQKEKEYKKVFMTFQLTTGLYKAVISNVGDPQAAFTYYLKVYLEGLEKEREGFTLTFTRQGEEQRIVSALQPPSIEIEYPKDDTPFGIAAPVTMCSRTLREVIAREDVEPDTFFWNAFRFGYAVERLRLSGWSFTWEFTWLDVAEESKKEERAP